MRIALMSHVLWMRKFVFVCAALAALFSLSVAPAFAQGEACEQCGPGPHFVDACGPFPPVGTDLIANNGAVVGIDLDFDCVRDVNLVLRPCPIPEDLLQVDKTVGPIDDSLNIPGTSPFDGHPTGPGLDVIDTEIIEMCLTNGLYTMRAGAGAATAILLRQSLGAVAEDEATPDPTEADSLFDVFFEVDGISGGPVYNTSALRLQGRIDCLPPAANYYHPNSICLPLTTAGTCVGGDNDGADCLTDSDCPGNGVCIGGTVLANLVSANHAVNKETCSDQAFPDCEGECPANEICVPFGDDGCRCEPEIPPRCEDSVFPNCDGDCPADEVCLDDPFLSKCYCRPLPCEQNSLPECNGNCPLGTICQVVGNGCQCVAPPNCGQSAFPACVGVCPQGTTCEADAPTGECNCVDTEGECAQCGPGSHFIDACGPFPPVGLDLVSNNGAIVGIDLDFDCVRDVNVVMSPCAVPNHQVRIHKTLGPIDDSQNIPGTSPVDSHPTGPGLDVIDTEIVSMCLQGAGYSLIVGVSGPSTLPLQPTLGTIAEDETTPDPSEADSLFDVFFEVQGVPGGPVYNDAALRLEGRIDCLPPKANYHHPTEICVPLSNSGFCTGGLNSGAQCVNDLDCPGGSCDGRATLANLVSANHSVNQPVCSHEQFPQCAGDCPPDATCMPVSGTNDCWCAPDLTVPCEDGPFPDCDGECPPGTCSGGIDPCTDDADCDPGQCSPPAGGEDCHTDLDCEQIAQGSRCLGDETCEGVEICVPDTTNDECICELPGPVPCEDSVYPVCDGRCPLGTICEPGAAGCECLLPPACEQSTFDECEGECPQGTICEPGPTGCECVTTGQECEQCARGTHFIDVCGPFPPVGHDIVSNNGAVVGIDLDFDCVRDVNYVMRPCTVPYDRLHIEKQLGPIDDSVYFPGTSPVDSHPTGPGLDVIDTEIVSMCLTGGGATLVAGTSGPSSLALKPTLGTIAEDLSTPDPTQADSRFDVFFEVSGVPGGPLYNQVPLPVQGRIDCLPPAANYYHPQGICIPLTTAGFCTNNNDPCIDDSDCPAPGTCTGTTVTANLVSANHSVNQEVCGDHLFPQCEGACPPDEICMESADQGCHCEPLEQQRCEEAIFPECYGGCPPGRICVRDSLADVCRCEPVECAQSVFPECDGGCPIGLICEPIQGICDCVPPPLCELSPYPECEGTCPPGTTCKTDTISGTCNCKTTGEECEQCGPGAHFIDACGPFPPVGIDLVSNNGAVVGIDLDFDCVRDVNAVLRPCPVPYDQLHIDKTLGPIDDSLNFPGTSPFDGHPTGPGLDVVDTEIVAMCLRGGGLTLVAGASGPSAFPLQPTLGTLAEDETTPDPTEADSFFDVYFEVSGVPGGPLYNQVPLPVEGRVDCLPPSANYHHPTEICIPLTTGGFCSVSNIPCVVGRDCPAGETCDGTTVLANLVQANHSVNRPLCIDTEWPVCDGDCPPDEICMPGPADQCVCRPIEPERCEDSLLPECDGECPPGTVCSFDQDNDACRCGPVECAQSVFPECDGGCPLGTVCTPGASGCECLAPPLCELSAFPVCLGECPAGTTCEPDTLTGECNCVTTGMQCEQCGPGAHFIDHCGPFPPIGTDLVSNNGAVVGVDLDFDCIRDANYILRPCPVPHDQLHIYKTLGPIDDSVNFPGISPVDGHPTGPGLDVIDTEIVSMCLTDGGVTLVAGVSGPSSLPLQPTLGAIAEDETTPDAALADSTFEVFFEVSGVPGGPLYNQSPLAVEGRIDCLPPSADYHHPTDICVPLTTQGSCSLTGDACISDADCSAGETCDGTVVMANLVSANHSVNRPACSDASFPECDGNCPADEACLANPDDGCRCVPFHPAECEHSPLPVCDGVCPLGEWCADVGLPNCACLPCLVPGPVKHVRWADKLEMFWGVEPCSAFYNVYRITAPRLHDSDGDGVAEDYGSCLEPDRQEPQIQDGSNPPLNEIHFYIVTGHDNVNEGTMGQASNGLQRPNNRPCP